MAWHVILKLIVVRISSLSLSLTRHGSHVSSLLAQRVALPRLLFPGRSSNALGDSIDISIAEDVDRGVSCSITVDDPIASASSININKLCYWQRLAKYCRIIND